MPYVKRRAPRRNTRNPRKNRRNAKGKAIRAYKPRAKQRVARQLAPIAESRKLTFINTTTSRLLGPTVDTENWYVHIPETWNNMYRENFLDTLANQPSSQGFTGKTLFSRIINEKVKIRFNSIQHYMTPPMVHVVYGWCKVPYLTPLQSSGNDMAANENGVIINHDRQSMIGRTLAQMYNTMFPTTDPKMFKLMYNKKFQLRGITLAGKDFKDPTAPVTNQLNIRKDLNYNITWKPNTKYHMKPATKGDGSSNPGMPPPAIPLKPDDGNINFGDAVVNNTQAYWTPSSKLNGDLWTPFFAVQITNADTYGRAADGTPDTFAYPYMFQKNNHYFYDL